MIELHAFDLDAPPAPPTELRRLLAPGEQARADRFVQPLHRDRFAVGRALLRLLLQEATGAPAAKLALEYGPNGKPRLGRQGPGDGKVAFNVSHSGRLLLVALADPGLGEVGVDIEVVRPIQDPPGVARQVFTEAECREILPPVEAGDWLPFYRLWTAKEAVLKLLGTGFSLDPRAFMVELGPGRTFRVESIIPDDTPPLPEGGHELETLSVPRPEGGRAAASVVTTRPTRDLRLNLPGAVSAWPGQVG